MLEKRLLCVGHVTLDTFLMLGEELRDGEDGVEEPQGVGKPGGEVGEGRRQVCFNLGDKVPVEDVYYGVGGGAANVATGTAKLGIETSLYTVVGSDPKGNDIVSVLEKHNVNCFQIVKDKNPTDQAVVVSYAKDRTIFTYSYPRSYEKCPLAGYDYIFISSIGERIEDFYRRVGDFKEKFPEITIFYNPGSRELAKARDDILEILPNVDYFISNVEEACLVAGQNLKPDQIEIKDLMGILAQKGPKVVVVTDGMRGSYIYADAFVEGAGMPCASFLHVEAQKGNLVEKTGAGDAYASGFIAAILLDKNLEEAGQWGSANSSAVISKVGAQEGLLSLGQINKPVP